MRATTALLLAGLAAGLVSAEDAPVRVEPKWAAGDRALVTIVVEDWVATDGGIGNRHMDPILAGTRTILYEERIAEVQKGIPQRTTRIFRRYETDRVTEKKPLRHPVQGKRAEFVRSNGVLQVKNDADRSRWLCDTAVLGRVPMKLGADWAWLFPAEAVDVGSSWTVQGSGTWSDVLPDLATGETTCTVLRVEGDTVLIRFHKPEERANGTSYRFRGEAEFSLETGRIVSGSVESEMESTTRREGTLTGTVKIKFSLVDLEGKGGFGEKDKVKPPRLRPGWRTGERARIKLVTTDVSAGSGKPEQLGMRTVEYDEQVTEVEDGRPTRVVRTFRRFETQRGPGEAAQEHAFAGQAVEFRDVDGVLKCAEDVSDLATEPMSAGADWSWLLPGGEVAVGSSWQIPAGDRLSTVHPALVGSGATCELASVEDGVALLRFGNAAGVTGEARFSIRTRRVVNGRIETVKASSKQIVTFEMEMRRAGKDEAPSSAELPVRLEPRWKTGERVLVKVVAKDTETEVGKREQILSLLTLEYEETPTEVKDGLPERVVRTFRRIERKSDVEPDLPQHPLAGKKVEFKRVDGVLTSDESFGPSLLEPMWAGADWAWLLPGKEVAVGDWWRVKGGSGLITVHWAITAGDTTCTLASVKDGIAVIRIRNTKGLRGEAQFSLEAGRVVKAWLEWSDKVALTTSTQRMTFELETLKGD